MDNKEYKGRVLLINSKKNLYTKKAQIAWSYEFVLNINNNNRHIPYVERELEILGVLTPDDYVSTVLEESLLNDEDVYAWMVDLSKQSEEGYECLMFQGRLQGNINRNNEINVRLMSGIHYHKGIITITAKEVSEINDFYSEDLRIG